MSDDRTVVPVDELIGDICWITGVGESRMKESIRGPGGNPERRFAVWAFRTSTYMTYRQIGEHLGMTVQHIARDVRRSRKGIEQFEEWTEEWLEKYPGKVSIV
jgi:hypothetical protein